MKLGPKQINYIKLNAYLLCCSVITDFGGFLLDTKRQMF